MERYIERGQSFIWQPCNISMVGNVIYEYEMLSTDDSIQVPDVDYRIVLLKMLLN